LHSCSARSDDEAYGFGFADADEAFALASAAAGSATPGDERTGLGVAGVLRRLRLWAREYGDRGFILLEAKEVTRWCKATARWVLVLLYPVLWMGIVKLGNGLHCSSDCEERKGR
jgi:hypothetical protein